MYKKIPPSISFSIRMMSEDDLPEVLKIENDVQLHPWSLQQIRESLESDHHCYICCESETPETIIGYTIIATVLDEWNLLNISIARQYQRQGYGRKYLQQLVEQGVAEGKRHFMLEVRASNLAACKLYESIRFECTGKRKDYYPGSSTDEIERKAKREDALLYSLSFSE